MTTETLTLSKDTTIAFLVKKLANDTNKKKSYLVDIEGNSSQIAVLSMAEYNRIIQMEKMQQLRKEVEEAEENGTFTTGHDLIQSALS